MNVNEQNRALEKIVANAEAGVSLTYLTGNAGTGKTYTAQQLVKLIKEGAVFSGWKVLDCAPQGKASDIAAGDADGTTMQSLFKINNRMVLPKGVGFMKYFANRDPILEVVTQAKRAIEKKLGVKSLKREHILVYIEEVMAASAEDLAAVRMIMQDLAKTEGIKFHILAVGHPLQNIDDYSEEVKDGDKVVCINYRTPAFKEPRWDNGEGNIVTNHSFFKDGDNWSVSYIHLTENKRQGEDPLGSILDKWTTGASIGEELLAILPKENLHVFPYGMKVDSVPVDTFITPSLAQEAKLNSTLVDCDGVFIFLPYIKVGDIEGYVADYNAKSCSVKLAHHGEEAEWIEIPKISKTMFRNCMRSMPVSIENVIVPGMTCLFRNNGANYKNGTMGRINSFSFEDKLVEVTKENGEVINVGYISSKELKGDAPFQFMYLPLMTAYAVTTGKVQGCTYNHAVGVCIDARNPSPKPHAAYVGMSRVTNINDLHIIISNAFTDNAMDLSRAAMIDQAMAINADALAFHAMTTGVATNAGCASTPVESTATETNNNEVNNSMDISQINAYMSTVVNLDPEGDAVSPTYYSTPEAPVNVESGDDEGIEATDIPTSTSLGGLGGGYIPTPVTETVEENVEASDVPAATSIGGLDLGEIMSAGDELIEELERKDEALEAAEALIKAQAAEIADLKAQLASAQKAASDAAIAANNAKAEAAQAKAEAKVAKEEAEAAKANAVPMEELLAIRAILDRIAPATATTAPVSSTSSVTSVPSTPPTPPSPPTPPTKEPVVEQPVVEEAKAEVETEASTSVLTFTIVGDKGNLKLKQKIADLTKAGFVYVESGNATVTMTTEGTNDISKGVFNIDKPQGRQLLTEYASRLVKS